MVTISVETMAERLADLSQVDPALDSSSCSVPRRRAGADPEATWTSRRVVMGLWI